jgi:hypothetical protein
LNPLELPLKCASRPPVPSHARRIFRPLTSSGVVDLQTIRWQDHFSGGLIEMVAA